MSENNSIPDFIKEQIEAGYIDENGHPLKCMKCEGTDFFEKDHSYINPGQVCEYSLNCKNCGNQVGYWAYGNWTI